MLTLVIWLAKMNCFAIITNVISLVTGMIICPTTETAYVQTLTDTTPVNH